MAFLKKCLGLVQSCFICGQKADFQVNNKWFCQKCYNKNMKGLNNKEISSEDTTKKGIEETLN